MMTTIVPSRLLTQDQESVVDPGVAAHAECHCGIEIEFEILSAHQKETALKLWAELEIRLQSQRLTVSYAWIKNWLDVYGDVVKYEFALVKTNQQVCGIALITHSHNLKNGYYKIRTLHLGTAGEPSGQSVVVEYNTLLIDEKYRQEFIKLILQYMQQRGDWDEIHLDGYESDELKLLTNHLVINSGIHIQYEKRESRYLDLANLRIQQVDVLSQLGKSTKSNIKRKLKAYGEIKLEWADNQQSANLIFEELVVLHQARWQQMGLPGAFASERFKAFQLKLIHKLQPEQKVILFKASAGGETIGCLMLLVDQGRMLDYLSGFAPFTPGTSPGLMTHYLCMEEALKRGYLAYDFLVGDKRHKENLGKESTTITWCKVQRKTWKFLLQEFLRDIKSRYRQYLPSKKNQQNNSINKSEVDVESTSPNH